MYCYATTMAELKTQATTSSVEAFLNTVEPEEKRKESFTLVRMMENATGEKPVMWGGSIVGFGTYHYKSERSRQEGDWMLVGFSPRKTNLTLYILTGLTDPDRELQRLGKFKTGLGCLYIKRLADVDQTVLAKLIKTSYVNKKKEAGQ